MYVNLRINPIGKAIWLKSMVNVDTVVEKYMVQSLHILVYIDPLLTYLLVSVPSILTWTLR